MALYLKRSQIEQMMREARAATPDECCGLLTGRREGERIVVAALEPSVNAWEKASERPTRFQLDPWTHLRVQRACRSAGLEIVGFYHSHPASPPVPSKFDLEMAWPRHAYVIITLLKEVPAVRSWRMDEEDRRFVEETIVLNK